MADPDHIIISLVVIVALFQLVTMAIMIYLWRIFYNLKNNVTKYKDSLPMVTINTPSALVSTAPTTPTAPSDDTLQGSRYSLGTKQKAEENEFITRLPTPNPDRRNACRQNLTTPSSTIAMTTKNKESLVESPRSVSFTSFNALSRDSGIFITTARDHGSLSSATSETLKDDHKKSRDSRGSSVFAEEGVLEVERTASNASRGSKIERRSHSTPSRDQVDSLAAKKQNRNEDHLHGRLFTMPIDQIDLSGSGDEKRYKRASRILNQMVEELDEIEATHELSYINAGYHGDDKTRAPLASEDSSCGLSSEIEQVDENSNEIAEEIYENQEIVDLQKLQNLARN